MAFNNYYLKINGTIYPKMYMVIPTYQVNKDPIIVNDYHDAAYNHHVIKAPKKDITISFSLRQLFDDEFPTAVAPFLSDDLEIEYFDAQLGDYVTATFTTTSSLVPMILRQQNNRLIYNELAITLTRKVANT